MGEGLALAKLERRGLWVSSSEFARSQHACTAHFLEKPLQGRRLASSARLWDFHASSLFCWTLEEMLSLQQPPHPPANTGLSEAGAKELAHVRNGLFLVCGKAPTTPGTETTLPSRVSYQRDVPTASILSTVRAWQPVLP